MPIIKATNPVGAEMCPLCHQHKHEGDCYEDCPLRHYVKAHPLGTSTSGYGCLSTGGHCIPIPECSQRISNSAALDLAKQLEEDPNIERANIMLDKEGNPVLAQLLGKMIVTNAWSFEEKLEKAEYTMDVFNKWCELALKKSCWYRFTNWLCYLPVVWRIGMGVGARFKKQYPDWIPALNEATGVLFAAPIVQTMNYESSARKIFKIKPL
jgi:hypothetical protein